MPRSEYDWKDGSPAVLGPHSLAKHTILREYVEEYIRILTSNHRIPEFKLLLVDGFAGGGEYVVKGQGDKIHPGSPFVLIDAVNAAEVRINASREKKITLDAQFIFVEKKRDNHRYLQNALEKRFGQSMHDGRIRLIHGRFEDHVDSIIHQINGSSGRKPRPIFVLDQYGYSAIPVDMIQRIMSAVPTSEVFLTLAVDSLTAYASTPGNALVQAQRSLHLDPSLSGFLDGRREIEELHQVSEHDRNAVMLAIQRLLHDVFAKQSGARCYTPFFITSSESHRSYWFLHLANKARANDAVKELHWKISNHFKHYGHAGTNMLMLGFDPSRQLQLSFDFGDSARVRTIKALTEELPQLIRDRYPNGVSMSDLYADICNETPASMQMLRIPVDDLCKAGEIQKEGAKGEERRVTTDIRDDDVIRYAKQMRLFPTPGRQ